MWPSVHCILESRVCVNVVVVMVISSFIISMSLGKHDLVPLCNGNEIVSHDIGKNGGKFNCGLCSCFMCTLSCAGKQTTVSAAS